MTPESHPCPHLVLDGWFPPALLADAWRAWPGADWPGWVRYDPAYEAKAASDLKTPLPPACGTLLATLAALPVPRWFGTPLVPDLSLHGAGLHESGPGPGVGPHLDADTHPRLGLARVLSAVLYLSPWERGWGGALELGGWSAVRVEPVQGRLVVFDCRDAYHAVAPVTCPAGRTRRSLALFWYAPAPGPGLRPRAAFAGRPAR